MARLFVCDRSGSITAEIEAADPILEAALAHEKADPVVRCAVLMALSALTEGGAWPALVLQCMAAFMATMKGEVASAPPAAGPSHGPRLSKEGIRGT
jgi:hypothetical protein